jgi:hypothetical protein
MKQILTLMAFFISRTVGSVLIPPVMAALPPQYQNVKDLEVMVNYVKANPDVAATVKSIDLQNKTVNYGQDCQATFERRLSTKPMGWVGPAEPLQFKTIYCPGR